MGMSKKFIIKKNLTKCSIIKIFTFFLLAWIYNTHDNKRNIDHFSGIEEKHVKIIDTVHLRSLAKHGFKEEREYAKLKDKLLYDGDMRKAKICSDARSTYGNLKNGELNELELYKKNYNHRYAKKGLKKLDCYWENKIFDKIEKVNATAERMQDRKKRFIKKILNKYTISLFLFALLPFLGGIIPGLFDHEKPADRFLQMVFGDCTKPNAGTQDCSKGYTHISAAAGWAMFYINEIISGTLLIVVILMFFYITVKYIKYQFLKDGIRNITLKECFRPLNNKF